MKHFRIIYDDEEHYRQSHSKDEAYNSFKEEFNLNDENIEIKMERINETVYLENVIDL